MSLGSSRQTKQLGVYGGPVRSWGRGWSAAGWLRPPSGFVAGHPRAALLFWFFGNFRSAVLFFMVVLVIYKYKNR